MSDDRLKDAAEAYARFFEELRPATLNRLDELTVPDVRFRDPFNDFTGRDRLKSLFRCMFEDLDEPQFEILDGALGSGSAYLRWVFRFRIKGRPATVAIDGVTELRFDDKGQVIAHIDHWDSASQFYEKIPVLGWWIRRVRKRLAV